MLTRREQPNLLAERRGRVSLETPLLISEALVPVDDRGLVYNAVAKGVGISRSEAEGLVRFLPADPASALEILDGLRQRYEAVYAALDEFSYGAAVQRLKERMPSAWTVLILETTYLRRRLGVHELLNLLTDPMLWRSVSTYAATDAGLEEAVLTAA